MANDTPDPIPPDVRPLVERAEQLHDEMELLRTNLIRLMRESRELLERLKGEKPS